VLNKPTIDENMRVNFAQYPVKDNKKYNEKTEPGPCLPYCRKQANAIKWCVLELQGAGWRSLVVISRQ
jgi:hypothetical protein